MSKRLVAPLLLFFLALICSAQSPTAPADWVNERIGTANDGQTFPSTAMPFAMSQWTPQTRAGNQKNVAPYYDADRRIQGFRGSHFLSGSATQDYGAATLMPGTGPLKLDPAERSSAFDRKSESLRPYRYAVRLDDYAIDAELTGAIRSGLMRFRYEKGGPAWILVEANTSTKGDGEVKIDAARGEVLVTNPVRRLYAGLGKLAGMNGYAVVQFDHPFRVGGTWSGSKRHEGATAQANEDGAPGAYLYFDVKPGEVVQARVGTSFSSLDEARANLKAELPDWNFDAQVERTRAAWNNALGRIAIEADAEHKTIFYTALYHTMMIPRILSDVDGSYPGFAGEGKIEHAKGYSYYDDFSVWDTFRAVHPLFTLIDPKRESEMVASYIAKGEQGGFLPIFPAWNSYTSEMVGNHGVAIIGDAIVKGLGGFDQEEAYRLMRKTATELPATHEEYVDGKGLRALDSYMKYGYIPLEDKVVDAFHGNEQVSRTLEYAYDDFVIGEVAAKLGHTADAELFHKRSQNYRNVIDPQSGYARGRHIDGTWSEPFDPSKPATYITEGLPSQYTFFVPQDVPGLIGLLGGPKAFEAKLDKLFAHGDYQHGNEPSHHLAYMYDYCGAAAKTQLHVREILNSQYANTVGGLAGNDDSGQISAWFVMSAMGIYSVAPGTVRYQIGAPLFDDVRLNLPAGKSFHILAKGAASKPFIRSATLNGKPLERTWLTHDEIISGGELVFEMSAEPAKNWPLQPPVVGPPVVGLTAFGLTMTQLAAR